MTQKPMASADTDSERPPTKRVKLAGLMKESPGRMPPHQAWRANSSFQLSASRAVRAT